MIKFGGHKQAAGLTIEASRIRELRRRVNDYADDRLGPDDLRPRLWIDGALPFEADRRTGHQRADVARAVRRGQSVPDLSRQPRGGRGRSALLKERHLKMAFKQDGRVMRGIAWRARERESFISDHRAAIDLAFSVEQDTWNGERYLQLSVADFRAPE